jgi:hypothetical protein
MSKDRIIKYALPLSLAPLPLIAIFGCTDTESRTQTDTSTTVTHLPPVTYLPPAITPEPTLQPARTFVTPEFFRLYRRFKAYSQIAPDLAGTGPLLIAIAESDKLPYMFKITYFDPDKTMEIPFKEVSLESSKIPKTRLPSGETVLAIMMTDCKHQLTIQTAKDKDSSFEEVGIRGAFSDGKHVVPEKIGNDTCIAAYVLDKSNLMIQASDIN